MTRRARIALIVGGSLLGLLLVLLVAAALVARSGWFREKVRQRIVAEVERATGGDVTLGAFRLDWKHLRAEVRDFVIHGTEPAGSTPLFRAASVAVGLKIVSVVKHDVDIEYVEVKQPAVRLIIYPDGNTNVPRPKIKQPRDRTAMETLLDLAIHRFSLEDGSFEVDGRGRTPFSARGRNLRASIAYELLGPRYTGDITIQPLDFRWGQYQPVPLEVRVALAMEKNRIAVSSARLAAPESTVELSGAVEDLTAVRGNFQYKVRVALAEIGRILRLRSRQQGTLQASGAVRFTGSSDYSLSGDLHLFDAAFEQGQFRLRDLKADAGLRVEPGRAAVRGLRLSATAIPSARAAGPMRVTGRIESVALRGNDVDLRGIRLAALDGSLVGNAQIADFDRFRFEGNVSGFGVRRLLAVVSPQAVPWDARVSGPVRAEGSLRRPNELRAGARLNLSPAAGAPVRGQIQLDYDARRGLLDLGRSSLQLPSTRLDISGAIGTRITVHLETRDLGDLLPLVGRPIPLELRKGVVVFDGTIAGRLQDPRINGTLSAGNVVYAGRQIDSFRAEIAAGRSGARLENAIMTRGGLQARFAASVGLSNWRVVDSSPLSANAALRDAPLADLLALAGQPSAPAAGTVTAAAQLSGTAGSPRVDLDLLVNKGSIYQEPFDRVSAKLRYTTGRAELAGAQLAAGARRIDLTASYTHAPGNFLAGLLRFQVTSNRMQLAEFQTVHRTRPGVQGVVRLSAAGAVDLGRTRAGQMQYRIADLQANLLAEELRMGDQPLGNAQLIASTQGDLLTAQLASDFAGSVIRGDGQWRLAGNYPGTLRVNFARVDFRRLQEWIWPPTATGWRVAGIAEGTLDLAGPAFQPELWKARLQVPKLEIGPAPAAALGAAHETFVLRNSGPIVVSTEAGVVRVESARLVGRSTDLQVAGTVAYQQKNAVDLRVNGRVDLAVVSDLNRDLTASGLLITDATVRGPLTQPAVNGRMELQNAAFNVADFPTGIYNASGVILFSGNRATIQALTGESGGGKVRATGFVAYSAGQMVFRLEADARQVRVRYPPGTSTVADANMNLTGTTASSLLSGTVTIVRTGFNPRSDFSSILARSAEPVRTPATRTGLLANMHFDVQIVTAPDIMFQSSLAQGIQADANLRLRGTATNPALLGRVNITQGQLVFFGTKYNISQGSIAFYNPVRIEPILNIDLETKARGIDVTLNVSGPLNKLNLTPRSDPPLQFSEIIALLATGRTPTSDPTLLAQQSTSPQTWQQAGASALLGQAIANPVAGRLQRFFGVTKLKIDPSLTGVENNPQARLTLEQQVTPEITFTYITNVTSSNPLVIRVEWAFSPRWSVVAVREENGLFGVDFLFKRHFR